MTLTNILADISIFIGSKLADRVIEKHNKEKLED